METINIMASTKLTIRSITEDTRALVSKLFGGVDDMHQLGNKALVVRAEIYPDKISLLYSSLEKIQLKITNKDKLKIDKLNAQTEYPLSLQITSFSQDTDGKIGIPRVPG